jgi:hypothetical protein
VITAIGTPNYGKGRSAASMSQRRFYGHGSIYRGAAIAVQHVGYSLTEERSDGTVATSGSVRGDAQVWLLSFQRSLPRSDRELRSYNIT